MNQELLKRLQLQAGGSHYPDINPDCQARFAELIVRECVDIIDKLSVVIAVTYNNPDHGGLKITRLMSNDIKKHFGVEE